MRFTNSIIPLLVRLNLPILLMERLRQRVTSLLTQAGISSHTHPTRGFVGVASRNENRILDAIYQPINNGVYRSGFAVSQAAYTEAVTELFAALEHWEVVLGKQPYLCGDRITIADWCLFTTLFRFDLAYYGLFKCNLKRPIDFPNLWNYCRKLYRYPGVRFSVGEANANGLQRRAC